MKTLTLFAVLAAASASVRAETLPCEMNSEWESKIFGLWINDGYINPDVLPRTATLSYKGCARYIGRDGIATEERQFIDASGTIGVMIAAYVGDDASSVALFKLCGQPAKYCGGASLETRAHRLVYWKGFGMNQVRIKEDSDRRETVKDVMLLPEGAILKP